jgi:prepilin-type N-terminal cleavage/methylation domain-containing protein
MPRRSRKRFGFTLIELMITVSIIGILASIAIPKFADMIRKSKEGTLKGNLGAIRSALAIYYADTEGNYPNGVCPPPPTVCHIGEGSDAAFDVLLWLTVNDKYLTTLPPAQIPDYHTQTNSNMLDYDAAGGWADSVSDFLTMSGECSTMGQWLYFFDPTQPTWGQVYVCCNHTDTKGTFWSSY